MYHKIIRDDLLVGIDIGSTNIKVIVYDLDAQAIAMASTPTLEAYRTIGISNQRDFDANKLWAITAETCKKAMSKVSKVGRIKGIAVSSVGCTAILLDKMGNPLYINPSSNEIEKEYLKFKDLFNEDDYFQRTGYPLGMENTCFYLEALKLSCKFNQLEHIVSVDDYINFKLTGELSRSYSTAASMGIWDIENKCWLKEFIETSKIHPKILGQPVNSGTLIGEIPSHVARETGLLQGTKVFIGGHDYECAALACHSYLKNRMLNVSGSVEIAACFSKEPKNHINSEWRTIIDHHVIPNEYSYMIEGMGAGQTEWLRRNIISDQNENGPVDWFDYFGQLDQLPETFTSTREIFIPHVYGCLPHKNAEYATGGFLGLTEHSTSVTMLRATLEGLSFQTKELYYHMKETHSKIDEIVMLGGGSRVDKWVQIKSDVINTPIIVPAIVEASALGAALLAGVGTKIYKNVEEASIVTKSFGFKLFQPNIINTRRYQDIYENVYNPIIKQLGQIEKAMDSICHNTY